MNWDVVEGNWQQAKSKVREQWDKLTDDQLAAISGKRDQLLGKIQECYGIARDEAERQMADWEARNGKWFAKVARRQQKNADSLHH